MTSAEWSGFDASAVEPAAPRITGSPPPIPRQDRGPKPGDDSWLLSKPASKEELDEAQKPTPYLIDGFVVQGEVSILLGPGGTGKSMIAWTHALEVITGRCLISSKVTDCGNATIITEDPVNEVMRRIQAIGKAFHISSEQISDCLTIYSLLDPGHDLHLVTKEGNSSKFNPIIYNRIGGHLARTQCLYAAFDPLGSFHTVNENDNSEMDTVARAFQRLAIQTGTAIDLLCHTPKPGDDPEAHAGKAHLVRGAIAIVNALRHIRTVAVLGGVSGNAKRLGVNDEADYNNYVRVDDGKGSRRKKLAFPMWLKWSEVAVPRPSGTDPMDYQVGVLKRFEWDEQKVQKQKAAEAASRETELEHKQALTDIAEIIVGSKTPTGMEYPNLSEYLARHWGLRRAQTDKKFMDIMPFEKAVSCNTSVGERWLLLKKMGAHKTATKCVTVSDKNPQA